MRRPFLLGAAGAVVVIGVIAARFVVEQDRRVDELEALGSNLEQARSAAEACGRALALEREGFFRLDGVVDSLRTAMEGFEDPDQGGVPQAEYHEYLQTFELYNDSVDAWQPRADSLQASEARCRALVEAHNALSDSVRRRREELTGERQ